MIDKINTRRIFNDTKYFFGNFWSVTDEKKRFCREKFIWSMSVRNNATIIARKMANSDIKRTKRRKKRFSELQRSFGISQTTLSKQLKILEEEGLIKREIYAEVPPRVEYSLSELGQKFKPVLDSIEIFGEIYIEYLKNRK